MATVMDQLSQSTSLRSKFKNSLLSKKPPISKNVNLNPNPIQTLDQMRKARLEKYMPLYDIIVSRVFSQSLPKAIKKKSEEASPIFEQPIIFNVLHDSKVCDVSFKKSLSPNKFSISSNSQVSIKPTPKIESPIKTPKYYFQSTKMIEINENPQINEIKQVALPNIIFPPLEIPKAIQTVSSISWKIQQTMK